MKVFCALLQTTDAEYNAPTLLVAASEKELEGKVLYELMDCWDYDGSGTRMDDYNTFFSEQGDDKSFIYTYELETDVEVV